MAMKRAYLKFGIGDIESKPNSEFSTRIQAAADGTASDDTESGETAAVGSQNDAQFLSPITVGGQPTVVTFDTGSSDLWLFNTNLDATAQRGHTIYDPTKSKTFKSSQNHFQISYGDGSNATGPVGFDTVDIGGATVDSQEIGLPNEVSQSFITNTASNGLVGLAFSTLNTVTPQQQKTFFENITPDLTEPVFTAQLKGGSVGAYEFGVIDKSAFVGDLAQVPVDNSHGFWEFASNTAIVNNQTTQIAGTAIADTGTTLMLVGNDLLDAYWGQVEGAITDKQAGGVIYPCETQLPDLQIAAGDSHMSVVPGVNMNFANAGTLNGQASMYLLSSSRVSANKS